MSWNFDGKVTKCDHREYGFAEVEVIKKDGHPFANKLFEGIEQDFQVISFSLTTTHFK